MRRLLLAALMLWSTCSAYSQESVGWLFVATAPPNGVWRPNDVIEIDGNNVMTAFWDYQKASRIIKLSEHGVLLGEVEVSAPDTTIIIARLFANDDEETKSFTALGLCHPDSGEDDALLMVFFDENLNVMQRKTVACADSIHSIFNLCVLKQSSGYKVAITELGFRQHYLASLDADGNLLKCEKLVTDSLLSICNLFEIPEGDGRFGMYARISVDSQAAMGVLVFDDSLHLVKREHFGQWNSVEGTNGSSCISYLCDDLNSMMLPLPDRSGYLISSKLKESLYSSTQLIQNDESSIIAKTDSAFVIQDHYEVINHLNDTIEYPAFYKSVDYLAASTAPCCIFQCSMQGNCLGEPGWPYCQTPLCVIVTKTDADLNVIWKKRFLTGKVYSPYAITATIDGGCAVAGMVYDFNSERRIDLFVLKINADGTVGLDEIQEESMAFVYPNPAKETMRIGGIEALETQVYDALGKRVMSFRGNEANVGALPAGVYLLRVADGEGENHTIRLVRE